MKRGKFVIQENGSNDKTIKTPRECHLYGEVTDSSIQIHFSETIGTNMNQLKALRKIWSDCTKGTTPVRAKQRGKNVIGFTFAGPADDNARQQGFDEIQQFAAAINREIKKSAQQTSEPAPQAQQKPAPQQTPQPTQPAPKPAPQKPAPQPTPQQKKPAPQKQPTPQPAPQPTPQKPAPQPTPQQKKPAPQKQPTPQPAPKPAPQKPAPQQQPAPQPTPQPTPQPFDKTKDIFGRPMKTAYPGRFRPGMTAAEEEAIYDEYWEMITHLERDIFNRKR